MTAPTIEPAMNAAADRYLMDRVLTASPAELTAMLFDACVGAIKLAIRLQEAGEHVAATPKLVKAQDIVLELRTTLNHDAGELATRLDALYTYAWQQLLRASLQRDTAAARDALEVVEPLQLAWRASCLTPQIA
ncbi:MAG: flagellar export chaperone FliS [Mycobacteriales bacterium]